MRGRGLRLALQAGAVGESGGSCEMAHFQGTARNKSHHTDSGYAREEPPLQRASRPFHLERWDEPRLHTCISLSGPRLANSVGTNLQVFLFLFYLLIHNGLAVLPRLGPQQTGT